MTRAKADLIAVLTLALLTLTFHWRLVFGGEVPLPGDYFVLINPALAREKNWQPPSWNALQWDAVAQYWAWRKVAHDEFQAGRIPLWNPYAGLGMPLLANPQVAVFYPLNLPFWLGDVPKAFAYAAILHTFISLLFTYLLCRSISLSSASSVVGAIVYGFSSFMVTWQLLPTVTNTAAWLPLLLLLTHKFIERPSLWRMLAISLATAFMLLAGHPQVAIYSLLTVAIYIFLRLLRRRPLLAGHWSLVTALAIAFTIASVQLLPTFEVSRFSHRAGAPTWEGYRWFSERGLKLTDMAMFFFPYAFGRPQDGSYQLAMLQGRAKENFADYCPYAGVGTLLLALLALAKTKDERRKAKHETRITNHESRTTVVDFGVLGALMLLLAMGTPLNAPLYFFLPGFSQLGTPTRCMFVFQLCLAVLAAFGLQFISHQLSAISNRQSAIRLSPNLVKIFVISVLTAELFWFGIYYNPTANKKHLAAVEQMRQELHRLLKRPHAHTPTQPVRILPLSEGWSLYKLPPALLPPNTASLLGFADVQAYDSLLLRRYKALMQKVEGAHPSPPENGNMVLLRNVNSPLLPKLGVCYVLSLWRLDSPNLVFKGKTSSGVQVYAVKAANQKTSKPANRAAGTGTTYKLGSFLSLLSLAVISALCGGGWLICRQRSTRALASSES